MASMVERSYSGDDMLNGPSKIIIKKENIGLEEYQHQKFQYNLFNNILKHDHYKEELNRFKDRLDRAVPNMQHVIHNDMKRVNVNKVYERKLNNDLKGPRGLNWQCKQELQRLESNERDVERELMRLKRELARTSQSCSLKQCSVQSEASDTSGIQIDQSSSINGVNGNVQSPKKPRILFGRSVSLGTPKTSVSQVSSISRKRLSLNQTNTIADKSLLEKQVSSKSKEDRSGLQQHALIIDQQRREIQEKLKHFLG